MNKYLLLFVFFLNSSLIRAQLSGTYTIGGVNPDYIELNDAILSAFLNGLSGDVTFKIRPGVYSSVSTINNLSIQNTLTITSESNNPDDVNVSISNIYNSQNIIIKNLTITPYIGNGTSYPYKGLEISRGYNVLIDSCKIIGQFDPQNRNGLTVDYSYGNVKIKNSQFFNLENGVVYSGVGSLAFITGFNSLEGCQFDSVSTAIRVNGRVLDSDTLLIEKNIITNSEYGVFLEGNMNLPLLNIIIQKNTIINPSETGIVVRNTFASAGSKAPRLINNMIIGGKLGVSLISVSNANYTVHTKNSVLIFQSPFTKIQNNSVFGSVIISSSNDVNLQNNSVISDTIMPLSVVMSSGLISDYNNFYADSSELISFVNVYAFETIDSMAFQLGIDLHSISVDPNCLSSVDLHTFSADLKDAGLSIGDVLDDIDGDFRGITSCCIGADEYNLPIGINDFFHNFSNLDLYPNPVSSRLYIRNFNCKKGVLLISDLLGREIDRFELVEYKNEIDFSKYTNGIYFISFVCDSSVVTKKIIKN